VSPHVDVPAARARSVSEACGRGGYRGEMSQPGTPSADEMQGRDGGVHGAATRLVRGQTT
jgi:hypothetical protein